MERKGCNHNMSIVELSTTLMNKLENDLDSWDLDRDGALIYCKQHSDNDKRIFKLLHSSDQITMYFGIRRIDVRPNDHKATKHLSRAIKTAISKLKQRNNAETVSHMISLLSE